MWMIRTLGVIGDVHAENALLKKAVGFLKKAGAEVLACTGDVADGPGSVDACCEILRKEGVWTVLGNHDRWFLRGEARDLPDATPARSVRHSSKSFLASLPPTLDLQTAAGPLLLCHGIGTNDMARLTPDDYGYAVEVNEDLQSLVRNRKYPLVVGGHTHRTMVRRFGAVVVINAGTLLRTERPGFLLIDLEAGWVQHYSLEKDGAVGEAGRTSLSMIFPSSL